MDRDQRNKKADAAGLKLPPSDADAEKAVLSAVLRDNATMDGVGKLVKASSFYQYAHQLIFECMYDVIARQKKPCDPVTLADALHERGWTADAGGLAYIVEIWESAPTTRNAEAYADIVRGCAIKRAIIRIGRGIEENGHDPSIDWKELIETSEREFFALAAKCRAVSAVPFSRAVADMIEEMDTIKKARDAGKGDSLLNVGLSAVDRITDGLGEGQLIVIGARTGVGKTVISLNMAFNIAESGWPVCFISLEQPRTELAQRIVSSKSGIDAYQIRKASIAKESDGAFWKAIDQVNAQPVYISDTPRQSVFEISGTVRNMVSRHGVKAIFIDYLQLMEPENKRLPRQEQISEMCRQMKLLARETSARIFLLCQINRESDKAAEKRPQIHQLKESGAIEENSDVIFLLYCEHESGNEMEVIIGKNRHGLKGVARVHFDRPRLRIMDRV